MLAESSASVDEEDLIDAGLPRDGSRPEGRPPWPACRVTLFHRLNAGEAGFDFIGHRSG